MNANAEDLDFETGEEVKEKEIVDVSAPAGDEQVVEDNPLLAEFVEKFDGNNADDTILWLRDSQEVSFPAAVRLFAELKKTLAPEGESKSAKVTGYIKSKFEQGFNRAQIIQLLQDEFEYSPKSAASVYSTSARTLGIISGGRTGGARVPMNTIVETLRGTDGSKAAYVAALVALGYSESTAAHFVNYVPMAKEWAKQELGA